MNDDNLKQINDLFNRLAKKGKPDISLMQKIAGHLEDNIHANLQSEGKGSPIPWAPLSKKYQLRKSKNSRLVQKILTATGQADQSIYSFANNEEAAAGTNKIYMRIHQFGGVINQAARSSAYTQNRNRKGKFSKGTTFGKGFTYAARQIKMPARPFLYLTDQYFQLIKNDIENYYSHL